MPPLFARHVHEDEGYSIIDEGAYPVLGRWFVMEY